MIKVILVKPLDGQDIGSEIEINERDFKRLEGLKAVKKAPAVKNKKAPAVKNKAS